MRRPPPGARLLLALALITWLAVRLPLLEQFVAALAAHPSQAVASDLPYYLALGDAALRHGAIGGWYDPNSVPSVERLADVASDAVASTAPASWRYFSYNDWGFGLVVAASWLLPGPDGVIAVVVFQYLVDALCLLLLCWIGTRLVSPWVGAAAALVYAVHPGLASLVNIPYIYYWGVVPPIVALAMWVRVYGPPADASRDARFGMVSWSPQLPPLAWPTLLWVAAVGAVIGAGTTIRSTHMLLIAVFLVLLLARERLTRRTLILGACLVAGMAVAMLPSVVLKYRATGRVSLSSREVFWHIVLNGLGCHENPWGLQFKDEVTFERIRSKYGVRYDIHAIRPYEEACKREAQALYAENPGIFWRNARRNILFGLKFKSVMPIGEESASVLRTLNNLRLLALAGLLCLLLSRRTAPHLVYWGFALLLMFLYPVAAVAPLTQPNISYIAAVLGPDALLAGAGLGMLGLYAVGWVRRR